MLHRVAGVRRHNVHEFEKGGLRIRGSNSRDVRTTSKRPDSGMEEGVQRLIDFVSLVHRMSLLGVSVLDLVHLSSRLMELVSCCLPQDGHKRCCGV